MKDYQKTDRGFSFSTARTSERDDLSFDSRALKEGSLVSKVSLLSSVSALFLAAGSYYGATIEPNIILLIFSVIVTFGGLFVLRLLRTALSACIGLAVWNAMFGISVGIGLQNYIAALGTHTVTACILGSAAVMAIFGCIGAFSGVDFRPMERILLIGLLLLILVGIVQLFVHVFTGFSILYASVGMLIFIGFFLVDFCRLARSGDNSWTEAADITINIVLDYVNFTFYLLRFVRDTKK